MGSSVISATTEINLLGVDFDSNFSSSNQQKESANCKETVSDSENDSENDGCNSLLRVLSAADLVLDYNSNNNNKPTQASLMNLLATLSRERDKLHEVSSIINLF